MRELKEIQRELAQKLDSYKATQNEADLNAIEALNKEYESAMIINKAAARMVNTNDGEAKELRNFNIARVIKTLGTQSKLDGFEAEVIEDGLKEAHAKGINPQGVYIPYSVLKTSTGQNASTNGDGGYLKEESLYGYIPALRKKMVCVEAGAQFLNDLNGKASFVQGGTFAATWIAEGSQASAVKETYAKVSLEPKAVTFYAAYSKDLLKQTSFDVDREIMDNLVMSHAHELDRVALVGSSSNGEPVGIINMSGIGSVAGGTNGAALTWANFVKLETEVGQGNGILDPATCCYVTNSKVAGYMKANEKTSTNGAYMMNQDGTANGYRVLVTNAIPSNLTKGTASGNCSAAIFGDFSQLKIGQWGGLDIVVDPFSLADLRETRIIVTAWNDVVANHAESFAACLDILA